MKAFTGGGIQTEPWQDALQTGQPAISLPGSPPHPAGKAASASEVCPAPHCPREMFPAAVIYWLSGNTRTLIRAEACERSYDYFWFYFSFPRLTLSFAKNSTNEPIATQSLLVLSQRRAQSCQSPDNVSVRKQLAVNRSCAQGKWQPSGCSHFLLPAFGLCQNKNNT